jgi:carbonic anhydrase/acetyltransferase-like protein (isoleucine patch superfamily)
MARICGQVSLGEGSSVWAGAVVRGDDAAVEIESGAHVLENCVVEAPAGQKVTIGERAIVSHGAIIHGATIGAGALIGIGAMVLDGAKVGEGAIVGAGAVVPPGAEIGPGMLALGIPAKELREVSEAQSSNIQSEAESLAGKVEYYREALRG